MQTTAEYEPIGALQSPPENVQLEHWPVRDDRASCGILAGLTLVVAVVAGIAASSLTMGLAAAVALAIATWRMWIPVRYELSPKGVVAVTLGRRRRIPWSAIRRCQIRRYGVLLLPTSDTAPISILRGLYLRWGNQQHAVLAIVDYYISSRVVPR